MIQTTPALTPQYLEDLQRLTQEYARYSRSGAGLGSALGGLFAYLILAVDLIGHGGRITFLGAYAPLPLKAVLALAFLPFLWLGALAALKAWWYQRHGAVEAPPAVDPRDRRRKIALAIAAPVLSTVLMLAIFHNAAPMQWLRAGLCAVLMGALAILIPRLLQGRMERMLGALLFLCPALLLAGIQMAAGDSLLALPVVGTLAIVLGVKEHLAYRRLEKRMAVLRGVE